MGYTISWGADVPVSMPETRTPDNAESLGGGHVFTESHLAHQFSTTDAEVFYQPTYAPLPSPEAADG